MDIKNIERLMNDMAQSNNTSLQSHGLSALITQVKAFVAAIDKEKDLVTQIPELQRAASTPATTDEEKKTVASAQEALKRAQQLKSSINNKQMLLRQLENEVGSLLTEIKKAI